MKSLRRSGEHDRGAAAVEMALVLPLLLLLVFGIIDFGRLLNEEISVTEAAREGARAATVGTSNKATAEARVKLIDPDYKVDDTSTFCNSAADVKVVVTYDFKWITPLGAIVGWAANGMTVKGTGVMPCRS